MSYTTNRTVFNVFGNCFLYLENGKYFTQLISVGYAVDVYFRSVEIEI